MNLHLTTLDEDFIQSLYETAVESMKEYPTIGFTTISYAGEKTGYHRYTENSEKDNRVNHVTFGDMLNTIVYGGANKFYFTRDDWDFDHTGKCVTYNDIDADHPYLELHYKGFGFNVADDNGIGIGETPYFPTYEDMFARRWYIVHVEEEKVI